MQFTQSKTDTAWTIGKKEYSDLKYMSFAYQPNVFILKRYLSIRVNGQLNRKPLIDLLSKYVIDLLCSYVEQTFRVTHDSKYTFMCQYQLHHLLISVLSPSVHI